MRYQDLQQEIKQLLSECNIKPDDTEVQVCNQTVAVSPAVEQALQYLTTGREPKEFDLPPFTLAEVQESRHYDKSEGFEVTLNVKHLSDIMTSEKAAWIAFSVQWAIAEPESVSNVVLPKAVIESLFDNVQLLKVQSTQEADGFKVKFNFHWVKRFSERIQQDAHREASKRAKEDQERAIFEKEKAEKEEFLGHIIKMMISKEMRDRVSTIAKYSKKE